MSGRKSEYVQERNTRLAAHVLAGESLKSFAIDNGMTEGGAWMALKRIGIGKYYLTADEWKAILRQRNLSTR